MSNDLPGEDQHPDPKIAEPTSSGAPATASKDFFRLTFGTPERASSKPEPPAEPASPTWSPSTTSVPLTQTSAAQPVSASQWARPTPVEPPVPDAFPSPVATTVASDETVPAVDATTDGEAAVPQLAAVAASSGGKRRRRKDGKREHRSFFRELPFLILIAFVLALVLKAFVVQAFFIPSGSMERTLLVKDRVLVNKLGYHFHDPHRGDIVVFNGKHTHFPPETVVAPATNPVQSAARAVQRFLGLGAPGERDYIKRVIGVGGDTIMCCKDGHVVVNGKPLNETYLYQDNQLPFCLSAADTSATVPASGGACTAPDAKPFVVPKGTLFVMGDHRSLSADSRFEGVIPKSSVIGRAFVLVWPFGRFDWFGTPSTFK